ncbi:MAG: phage holin family protein [Pirellulales bacterium]
MNNEPTIIEKFILWGMLAGFGGAVKFVAGVLRSPDIISRRRFACMLGANMAISGFAGLMGALVMSTLTPDNTWQFIAAGIVGYLGTQGLDMIALGVQRKLSHSSPAVSSVIPVPPRMDPAAKEE